MTTRARFGVGDLAVVELPAGATEVRVVEDRGPLGVGGRRLVRVQVLDGGLETPIAVELPEELLLEATPERRQKIRSRSAAERHVRPKGPASAEDRWTLEVGAPLGGRSGRLEP